MKLKTLIMPDHAYITIDNQPQHQFMQHRIHKILLIRNKARIFFLNRAELFDNSLCNLNLEIAVAFSAKLTLNLSMGLSGTSTVNIDQILHAGLLLTVTHLCHGISNRRPNISDDRPPPVYCP